LPTTYTASPSTVLPGQVIGAPITHLPWVFVCQSPSEGRHCGWARAANSPLEVPEVMKAKRQHEEKCQGGLIVAGG
jgi:hypothetical protein